MGAQESGAPHPGDSEPGGRQERGFGLETLLVGIDAACLEVLEPLFETDVTPTLRSIFADGIGGPLPSQIPPWTASAWPTIYTGTNPGKHGVFDFLTFEGYDWDVVNATHVRERPLWQLLDYHGRSSVVVNVPVTHPPEPFDGALVPGYVGPEDPTCHPEGLLDELREAVGDYRVYPPAEPTVEEYRALVRSRGSAFRYLADRFEPEFGFLEFQATDLVFHDRPGDDEAVEAIYAEVDEQVRATLDACEPDTVIVVSDHGIGPYGGAEFRINEFLRELGYIRTRRGGRGMPTWANIRDGELKSGAAGTVDGPSASSDEDGGGALERGVAERGVGGVAERGVAALARVGVTSQRIERALAAVGIRDVVAERVPADLARAGTEQVDFPRSLAYARSRIECGVRINLEGREPEGTVPPSEYDAVREELIAVLSKVETPDGDPVFEDVAPREDYYEGPEAERAVDVVTVPNDFDQFLSATLAGDQFGPPSEPWNHKRQGVFAAQGEGIESNTVPESPQLVDVAPTVLATLGVPADERMDGEPLPIVEPAGERPYPEYEPGATRETDDDAVERRLSQLGYLE